MQNDGLPLLDNGVMYQMCHLRLTRDSAPFPFPEHLLSTESYMPFLPPINSRRLKNVSVMLIWTNESSGTRYVIVSLAEAETLRRVILRDTRLNLKQYIQLSAVDSATLAIPLTPEIISIERPQEIEGMMSDTVASVIFEQRLQEVHKVRACDTAIISSMFFNNDIHYNDSAIVALITVFESVGLAQRIEFFKRVLCCRLRDQLSWECTSIANFFTNEMAHDLRKVFDSRATLVRAIVKEMRTHFVSFSSLRALYDFMCDPETRLLTAESMSAAIRKFRQNSSLLQTLQTQNLSELVKYQTGGANLLTWLQFQRMVSIELHENPSKHEEIEDTTSPFSPKATAGSLDALMQNLDIADKKYFVFKLFCTDS